MMKSGKIITPLFFLLALLFIAYPVTGLEYLTQPVWEIPLINSDNPANQTPVIRIAKEGHLISVNFLYEPVFFVYDGNGSLLFQKTLSADRPPWLSSISIVPDGTGLVVTQLVPGCCHGSVSTTSFNKAMFLDRSGRIVWEFVTFKPPLASVIVPDSHDIILGTEDGRILSLDRNGSVLWTTTVEAPVVSLAVSKDGRTVVAGGDSNDDASRRYGEPLSPYDLFFLDANGTVLGKYQTRGRNTVATGMDSSAIAIIGGPFGNLMLFNRTGTKTSERSFQKSPSRLSINGDGTQIFVMTPDGQVWRLDEKLSETMVIPAATGSQGFAVSDTGDILARGETRNVTLYDITGGVIGTYPTENSVLSISAVPETGSFIIGTEHTMIFLRVTVPASSNGSRPGPDEKTGKTPQSGPVPVLPGIIAIGLCVLIHQIRMSKT